MSRTDGGLEWVNTRVPAALQKPALLSALAVEAQAGDQEAMTELAWRMRPLVYRLSVKYGHGEGGEGGHTRYSEEQRIELRQAAWVGWLEAIQRWDPDHPSGMRLWTVASYRITTSIKLWQAHNSGSLPLTRHAWEQAWRIQQALGVADLPEWEEMSDADLKAATGVHSAGAILRARQNKLGHLEELEAAEVQPADYAAASAEDDAVEGWQERTEQDLASWLLHWGTGHLTEVVVYRKLEELGLAGEVDAQQVLDALSEQEEQA